MRLLACPLNTYLNLKSTAPSNESHEKEIEPDPDPVLVILPGGSQFCTFVGAQAWFGTANAGTSKMVKAIQKNVMNK